MRNSSKTRCGLRLAVIILLNSLFGFIGWGALHGQAQDHYPPPTAPQSQSGCIPNCQLSKPISPTILQYGDMAVYTVTNASACTDTFVLTVTSPNFLVKRWEPTAVKLAGNQAAQISVDFLFIVDAGTVTETITITATSQMSQTHDAVITGVVVMPGSTLPGNWWMYLPLLVSSP